jgi:peptidoglycan/LPS O-acetylase OafA/YrhL
MQTQQGGDMSLGKQGQRVLPYRPDIDGLRAIAVAAVILFHAQKSRVGGGYVGVDIFFVISGYLITQLLLESQGEPLRQCLAGFYLRRARRILPALLVTSLVVTLAATWILLPRDLVKIGEYLAATSLLATNVAAWTYGGYFQAVYPSVLRHFWSIAVEEQFYVIFPLVLIVSGRFLPRHRWQFLTALAAVSLALCIWASDAKPLANFYLAPFRAWELLLGAALAAGRLHSSGNRIIDECLAGLSLGAIVLTILKYTPSTPYPGAYALVPCVATAVLILTARNRATWVSRLLSTRILVFTGLISYSLYLWHAPILILYAYYDIREPAGAELAALLAVVYLVAALSWRIIEQPIRLRRFLGSDRNLLRWILIANALVLITGIVLWRSEGFPGRFSKEVQALVSGGKRAHRDFGRCMTLPPESVAAGNLCAFGPRADGPPKVVVWGDSHAVSLMTAYEHLADSLNVRVYFAGQSSCKPLFWPAGSSAATREAPCVTFNSNMLRAIQKLDPRLVILNARWINPDENPFTSKDAARGGGPVGYKDALADTVRKIATPNRSVCVVLDVPTLEFIVPYARAMALRRNRADDFLSISRSDALSQQRGLENDVRTLRDEGLLLSADPKDVLCASGHCAFKNGAASLYSDTNHLSAAGALYVEGSLAECFKGIARGTNPK